MTFFRKQALVVIASLSLTACAGGGPEMETVDYVDLERFMGDWYVIANIPTFLDDGTIATTFTFRDGSFDGEEKQYNPKGFVRDTESNAIWGMRFIWPIMVDYLTVYLDEDYSQTIIGRQKRDFVWVMAREPDISESDYQALLGLVESLGYDTSRVERVPQKW